MQRLKENITHTVSQRFRPELDRCAAETYHTLRTTKNTTTTPHDCKTNTTVRFRQKCTTPRNPPNVNTRRRLSKCGQQELSKCMVSHTTEVCAVYFKWGMRKANSNHSVLRKSELLASSMHGSNGTDPSRHQSR